MQEQLRLLSYGRAFRHAFDVFHFYISSCDNGSAGLPERYAQNCDNDGEY